MVDADVVWGRCTARALGQHDIVGTPFGVRRCEEIKVGKEKDCEQVHDDTLDAAQCR